CPEPPGRPTGHTARPAPTIRPARRAIAYTSRLCWAIVERFESVARAPAPLLGSWVGCVPATDNAGSAALEEAASPTWALARAEPRVGGTWSSTHVIVWCGAIDGT